jgi:hypothetical protein
MFDLIEIPEPGKLANLSAISNKLENYKWQRQSLRRKAEEHFKAIQLAAFNNITPQVYTHLIELVKSYDADCTEKVIKIARSKGLRKVKRCKVIYYVAEENQPIIVRTPNLLGGYFWFCLAINRVEEAIPLEALSALSLLRNLNIFLQDQRVGYLIPELSNPYIKKAINSIKRSFAEFKNFIHEISQNSSNYKDPILIGRVGTFGNYIQIAHWL